MDKKSSITPYAGTYMLCKSILGASITNVPGVFTELGIALGILVFAAMAVINYYSLYFITLSAKKTSSQSLDEIGESIDQKKGKIFVTFSLFTMCMIPLIFYIIKSTLYLNSFLNHFGVKSSYELIRIVVSASCLIMCLAFKKADKLKYVNIVGLASLSCLCFYTIYLFATNFNNIEFKNQNLFKLNSKSIERISVVCFAFCSQFSILNITTNFDSMSECRKVIMAGNGISLLVYLLTGICGHFVGNGLNTEDFFESVKNNKFTEFLKLTLAIVNISTFPLIMLAAREAFDFFVRYSKKLKDSSLLKNFEISFLVLVCYLVSIPFDRKTKFLSSTFFFAGSVVMFALPSYFYFRVMRKELRVFDYVMLIANVLLTLFGMFAGIYIWF